MTLTISSISFLGYLCPPEANIYGIDFIRFKLRDCDTGETLFEVLKQDESGNSSSILVCLFSPTFCLFDAALLQIMGLIPPFIT